MILTFKFFLMCFRKAKDDFIQIQFLIPTTTHARTACTGTHIEQKDHQFEPNSKPLYEMLYV